MNNKQKILTGTNWGLFILLSLSLFVIVNYLSFRHYKTYDMTFSGEFSLSPETKKFLRNLKDEIEVFVLLPIGDESYDRVERLLTAFRTETSKIKVEYLDPERDRDRYELILKKYSVTTPNSVVFANKDRSKWVEKDQFLEYDFSSYQFDGNAKLKNFKGEGAFLNAMYEVVDPKKPKIYFTTGHGERKDYEENNRGIYLFKERLSKEGALTSDLQTLGLSKIPEDASLVIVASPQKPFTKEEADVLENYLDKGGALFLFLDPLVEEGKDLLFGRTGLEEMCSRHGIELLDGLIVDPEASLLSGRAQTFFGVNYSSHSITTDLMKNKYPILFILARPLKLQEPVNKDFKSEVLISTSGAAWAETNLKNLKEVKKDPDDPQGVLTLSAVSYSEKNKKSRMVVVGDCDIISEGAFLSQLGGNSIFALNCVRYLVQQEERISIPPKEIKNKSIVLTSTQLATNFVILVILLPFAVALIGVFVYFSRKR
ncbi:MAG: GldG family protein [Acidobacteria bacterium]|nr:GldG family protein [Acidobacteriota bacterium]